MRTPSQTPTSRAFNFNLNFHFIVVQCTPIKLYFRLEFVESKHNHMHVKQLRPQTTTINRYIAIVMSLERKHCATLHYKIYSD